MVAIVGRPGPNGYGVIRRGREPPTAGPRNGSLATRHTTAVAEDRWRMTPDGEERVLHWLRLKARIEGELRA